MGVMRFVFGHSEDETVWIWVFICAIPPIFFAMFLPQLLMCGGVLGFTGFECLMPRWFWTSVTSASQGATGADKTLAEKY